MMRKIWSISLSPVNSGEPEALRRDGGAAR